MVRKPEFKKAAVHRSAILKRCKDLIPHFSGNNATALIFSPLDPPEYLLAPWRIPIFPIQIGVYATFIHIGNLFCWYVLNLFLICCYFFLILLLIARCLFFVLSHTVEGRLVYRFRYIQTPPPAPTGMRPDALPHRPSVFQDRSFGNSDAALSSPNPPFLLAAVPISVSSISIL